MRKSHFRLSLMVFVAYSVAVCLIAFWPVPVDQSLSGTLEKVLAWLHLHEMPTFINYQFIEFSSNIFFFIPMGVILALWIKRRLSAVTISTYVSIAIEMIQEMLLPQRFSSVFDIIANTVGAALGAFVFCPLAVRFMACYDARVELAKSESLESGEWLEERWPEKKDM